MNYFQRLIFCLLVIPGYAASIPDDSTSIPEVGKPVPQFSLSNITNFERSSATNDDFKGRWLILNLWYPGCISCITGLDKINTVHEKTGDSVQVLLIGLKNHNYPYIESFYEKIRRKKNLTVPSAFDSVLFERWGIYAMPKVFIIDPDGIVRVISTGADVTAEKVNKLIAGKDVDFAAIPGDIRFDPDQLNPGRNKLIYRTLLTTWNNEVPTIMDVNYFVIWPESMIEKGYKCIGVPLDVLYKEAYIGESFWDLGKFLTHEKGGQIYWSKVRELYGKFYPDPVIEVTDPSPFIWDRSTGIGTYNYVTNPPPDHVSRKYMMDLIRKDLQNVFGYAVTIEKRAMPVINLVKLNRENHLRTKGGDVFITQGSKAAGFTIRNESMDKLLIILNEHLSYRRPPFFNATGTAYNIDITIDADLTNFEAVRAELRKNGLDLVQSMKRMKVLVIRDRK
jgi:peroxiredoxin